MKDYTHILFDLDGTIIDSAPGIIAAVLYTFQQYNIEIKDQSSLIKFIGPPLLSTFQSFVEIDSPEEAIAHFRTYYTQQGMFEGIPYVGIEDLLNALKSKDLKLVLATSKPEVFAKKILKHFHLAHYFDFVGGASLDETRTDKAEVIAYVLEQIGVEEIDQCLMIGDRHHDITGAITNHMDAVGVLYGYGSEEELQLAGARYIVKDVDALRKLLA